MGVADGCLGVDVHGMGYMYVPSPIIQRQTQIQCESLDGRAEIDGPQILLFGIGEYVLQELAGLEV